MTTREDILARFPLDRHLRDRGIQLRGGGVEKTTNVCANKEHKKDHLCVSVNLEKGTWHCFACEIGGSIIDWIAMDTGKNPAEVMKELAAEIEGGSAPAFDPPPEKKKNQPLGPVIATYDYFNESGDLVYRVRRHAPKTFRQCRPGPNGTWIENMEGVTRVLYNILNVMLNDEVWIVEGEKDADNLNRLGFTATTNVGGGGNWKDAYAEALRDKDVVICPDKDETGAKHLEAVKKSLEGKVRSVRVVRVPDPHKDVSDWVDTMPEDSEAQGSLEILKNSVPQIVRGVDIAVYTIREVEARYRKYVKDIQQTTLNLSNWLPSLQNRVRSIVPGEFIMFIADTGVGKTALLSNLALHAAPLATLFFELELPETLLYERTVAAKFDWACREVEDTYVAAGANPVLAPHQMASLEHIFICPTSRMSVERMRDHVVKAELKTDRKIQLVLVDYMQLVNSQGKSRYERASMVAEELKIMAKELNVIVVASSQVARKEDDAGSEVTLHDAKDSGSIENSSGLVIGAWRDDDDPHRTLWLKILKQTKGTVGHKIKCNFRGETMRITECSPIDPDDVPTTANSSPEEAPEPQQEFSNYAATHPDP